MHIDPLNPKIWTSLGILFSRLHQYHDAVDAHGRALRIDPSLHYEWGNMASLYDLKGQPRDAIEAYDIALTLMEQTQAKGGKSTDVKAGVETEVDSEEASFDNTAALFRKRIAEIKADMTANPVNQ